MRTRHACLTAVLTTTVWATAATAAEIKILGLPAATAIVGEPYRFVPGVADADMSHLQFAYRNLPSWSGSYRGSGAIIGTPTEPGVFPNIQIEAWDGIHFGISAPFTITVRGTAANAKVALRWVKPLQNTDGSPLTDLAGYVIRYGTDSAYLDRQLLIGTADATSAEIEGLAPGDWYFEIASVTDAKVRGPFSETVRGLLP